MKKAASKEAAFETVEKPQKCGISEGKIVTKENHQGCLSCIIISFENFFEVFKTCSSVAKTLF